MQGTRADRIKHIFFTVIIPIIVLSVLIFLDRFSKVSFKKLLFEKSRITLINDFFYFTYTFNEGSAYSFLANVSWAQTFFKILTPIALVCFVIFYLYSIKKGYKFLTFSIVMIIAGTVGNYIDRLMYSGVIDFICIEIAGNRLFGIFNLADVFLTFGVIFIFVHYLFLDENAIFNKKKTEKNDDGQ